VCRKSKIGCGGLICLVLILAFGVVTSAKAAQIAYEGFDGKAGTDVDGSSGGTGWPGMTFANLDTAGLKAVFIANGAYTGKYTRPLASSITVDASNPEVWVSALVEIGTGSGDVNIGRGIGVELYNGETKILGFGKGLNKQFGVGPTLTGGGSFVHVAGTRTVGVKFLSLKLAWDGAGTQATVYVATGEEEGFDLSNVDTFTGSVTITLTSAVTFDVVALYGSHSSTTSNGVDEIRIGNSYGDVIGAPNEALASEPSPANKEEDVLYKKVVLSWRPGAYVTGLSPKHKVFFSENFDDVHDGIGGITQDPNLYPVGATLDFSKTYYWRVDEANSVSGWDQGDVWQFTVEPIAYPISTEYISATASSSDSSSVGPENTINGSGLDADDLHSVENNGMWLSSFTGAQPTWIQYEFDRIHKLHQMWVWNHNTAFESMLGFGLKDVSIEYSTDGSDWKTLGGVPEFAQAPGTVGYAHNTTVDLGGIAAKYVRLTVNSNWGDLFAQYGLSEVRFLYIPVHATEPNPDSGATDVSIGTIDKPIDVILGFTAGREADKHNVYFSDSKQAVIDGTAYVDTVTETSYVPLSLDLGTTYYWRVDEVNEAEIPTTWQGDIWDFTTQEYFVVEDFEDYNDWEPDRIFDTWIDGWETTTNGSAVGYAEPDFIAGEHHVETTIVHGGAQSMPFFYDNNFKYSEATMTLVSARDWTEEGIGVLSLWFYGDTANAAERMYVNLNGIATVYHDNPDAALIDTWTEWTIDLQEFAAKGVNLANVNTITIGFGDKNNLQAGGSGMVLFDDIRLYRPAP